MRLLVNFLFIASLVGCSAKGQYKIEKKPMVALKEAYYQSYVAGIEGGGSGTSIFLLEGENSNEVELIGLYFQEKYTKLKFHGNGKFQGFIRGEFNWQRKEDAMEGKKKKHQEKTETIEEIFPFKLEKNEAVISFFHRGKLKYNKIQLVEKEMETMPQ